jgi:hypothetical protein
MTMNHSCPVCGLRFEREPGYFYGAMYVSYAFVLLTTSYWIVLLAMGVNPWIVVGLPALQIILMIPLSFRYSRVGWLALDHAFDPGYEHKWEDGTGPKQRQA